MQRSSYRQSYEPYPAARAEQGAYEDRYQPSPYRQAPIRHADRSFRPDDSPYGLEDAGDRQYGAPRAEPSWQSPAAPRHWSQPSHTGRQQMLHPHDYPAQARPESHAPAPRLEPQRYAPSQSHGHAPARDHGSYGRPSPDYPSYGETAPGYGRERMGGYDRNLRDDDARPSRYGAEPTDRELGRSRHGDEASYRGSRSVSGPQGSHYGNPATHVFAGAPSHEAQTWPAQPRDADPSIEDIRATLRECREAIRELGDKRTRRRYF